MDIDLYHTIELLVKEYNAIPEPQLVEFYRKSPNFQASWPSTHKDYLKFIQSDEAKAIIDEYMQATRSYRQQFEILKENVKKETLAYLGLTQHPKAELLWKFAEEYGGYSSYSDGAMYYLDSMADAAYKFAQLIK